MDTPEVTPDARDMMDPATWPVSDNADRGTRVPSDEDLRATYEEARRQM